MTKDTNTGSACIASRRQLLKAGAALGVGSMFGFPAILRAQTNQSIKIGVPTILSGRVAQFGISSRNALQLEFDKFTESGGFTGRKVAMVVRASRGKPETEDRNVRDMFNHK